MPCYRGWLGLETALEWPKTASKIPVSGDLIMLWVDQQGIQPKGSKKGRKPRLSVPVLWVFCLSCLCVSPYCNLFITNWASAVLGYCKNLTESFQTCGFFISLAKHFSSITHVGLRATGCSWGWRCFVLPIRIFLDFHTKKNKHFSLRLNLIQNSIVHREGKFRISHLLCYQADCAAGKN